MKHPFLALTALFGAVGGGAVSSAIQQPRPQASYPEASQRGNARVFYWGSKGDSPTGGSIGQFAIDYGQPAWQPKFEGAVEGTRDQRWRLGQNFWTNLDTNIDLTIAGVDVPVGYYYLGLEHTSDGDFILWAIDPAEARERHLDAFEIDRTEGGIAIPLTYEKADPPADRLTIRLLKSLFSRDQVEMRIEFGPHRLKGEVTMHPAEDGV